MIAHNYDNNNSGNVKGYIELINSIINGVTGALSWNGIFLRISHF